MSLPGHDFTEANLQAGGVESAACAVAENQAQESKSRHISLDFFGKGCYCYGILFQEVQ